MSMTMPAGWYPDPGHSGAGPAPERWWDGAGWTGRTREAGEAAEEPPASPAPEAAPGPGDKLPELPVVPAADPEESPRRAPLLGAALGGSMLVALLVASSVLLIPSGGDEDADVAAASPAGTVAPGGEPQPDERSPADDQHSLAGTPGEDEAAPEPEAERPGPERRQEVTSASVGGAALPVLDGWQERGFTGAAAVTGVHPCPAGPDLECAQGGAFLFAGPVSGQTPQEAALADIPLHAAESFSEETYGGIVTEHEVLSEEITITGRPGYRVRWQVETGTGTDAYAETVAFPAPDGSAAPLLLRLGFNAGDQAPPAADMDRITDGIRAVSDWAPGTDV